MAAKNGFTAGFEYAMLRMACGIVNAIPYTLAIALADVVAHVAVRVFGVKRERTMERLRFAFPGRPSKELEDIALSSFANILKTGVEMMRAPALTKEWMDAHVSDGKIYKDKLQKYVDEGRGVVIMVPHTGNWYMAAWSMAKYGLPLFAIAARQKNPKIDAWMKRQYGDIEVVERGSARTLVEIKEKLRKGRAFAILPDLRSPVPDVEVDFLGGKANVSHAGAMFAVAAGAPIVVAMMRREGGRHMFEHLGTLRPDPSADRREEAVRLTHDAMRLIDEGVRRHPGQWFWYNKRWVLQPVKKKGGEK